MKQTYTLVGFISQVTSRSVRSGCCLSGRWFVCSQGSGCLAIHAECFLSKGYGRYCRPGMEMQSQAQGMELFHDFVLLSQCQSRCILAWWLQSWISKAPGVSVGSKGETAVPPRQLFIRILVPVLISDTFTSLVKGIFWYLEEQLILWRTREIPTCSLAPCAALPLPALAVQAALPGPLLKLLSFCCP